MRIHGHLSGSCNAWYASLLRTIAILAGVMVLCLTAGGCRDSSPDEAGAAESNPAGSEAQPTPRKVLLVHSYHRGYSWVDSITRGVRMGFPPRSVDLQVFHMDTKRNTSLEWKQQMGGEAMALVDSWQPDVVIACDDNAQEYFAKKLAGRDDVAVVFCGVNAAPALYGYPAVNVTGVLECPHFTASLAYLKRLVPSVQRVAVMSDNSPTSTGALGYMKTQKTDCEIVSYDMPETFEQWQETVARCQKTADAIAIYTYHTVKDSDGQCMEPEAVMAWTVKNSGLPIVGFFVFSVDHGALCGYLESGVEHGLLSAKMAVRILSGTKAGDIPMVTALDGQSMLNMATARKLGITPDALLVRDTDIVVED